MISRIYVAERTIFIDWYLEASMSYAFVRNDFVLLSYTVNPLNKNFKGIIVVLSKQLFKNICILLQGFCSVPQRKIPIKCY